jgi:DNA-binding CsgD family transcriptional regulator/PAS domain-containing protein
MGAVRPGSFDQVVSRFCEAIILPELLPTALHELAIGCGAEGAAIHLSNGLQTLGTAASGGLGELHSGFVKKWRAPELNSHRARGLELIFRGWQGALTEQDCFTPQELLRDPFHQELFVPSGFSSFAGIILAKEPSASLSTSIIRSVTQGPYTPPEIVSINALASQLRAIGNLAIRMGFSSAKRIADTFAAAGEPIALIGNDGCVLHLSPSFERLTRSGSLSVKGRRLGSWHADANRKLAAAIERAVKYHGKFQTTDTTVALPRRNGRRPLVASIVPVVGAAHDILHLVAALVSITDLEIEPVGPPLRMMQELFGLSLAEAGLAHAIAVGKTLPEIAASGDISRETLRSRLKSIFDKTGTARQADLAMLLAKLPKGGHRNEAPSE